jgi:glycosyltransferase involved in cell wall biosynthesis
MLPLVSVIVITKNNVKTIEKCIVNLKKQDYPKEFYEIIFVDGNSYDGTQEIIKKHLRLDGHPHVKFYTENVGTMGFARNLGVKNAKGDILVFIDGDAYPPDNWLSEVVRKFMDQSDFAIVGGMDILTPPNYALDSISSWRRFNKSVGVKAVSKIRTVNFAIKRDVLISYGGFDPRLSHFDEAELMARLFFKWNIRNVLYDPKLFVFHERGKRSLTSRIKKVFNKSVIGLPVLFRPYMVRMAISNPLSAIGTSLFFVFASLTFTILIFSMALGLIPIIYILFFLAFGVIFVIIYAFNMKRHTGKFESKIVFILMLDCLVRFVGTLFGLIRLLSSNIYRKLKFCKKLMRFYNEIV